MTPSDPNEDGFPVPPVWLLLILAAPIILIVAALTFLALALIHHLIGG